MQNTNLLNELITRDDAFRWLSEIFSCLGSFTSLPSAAVKKINPELERIFFDLEALIESEIEKIGQEAFLSEIATQGTCYFESSQEGIPLPLYGSWWLEGKLQGESTYQVAEILRAEGCETVVESADYLPTELEFVSLLYQLEIEGHKRGEPALVEKAQTLRKAFVEAFMISWLPAFEAQAKKTIKSSYWQTVIVILGLLLRAE